MIPLAERAGVLLQRRGETIPVAAGAIERAGTLETGSTARHDNMLASPPQRSNC